MKYIRFKNMFIKARILNMENKRIIELKKHKDFKEFFE